MAYRRAGQNHTCNGNNKTTNGNKTEHRCSICGKLKMTTTK